MKATTEEKRSRLSESERGATKLRVVIPKLAVFDSIDDLGLYLEDRQQPPTGFFLRGTLAEVVHPWGTEPVTEIRQRLANSGYGIVPEPLEMLLDDVDSKEGQDLFAKAVWLSSEAAHVVEELLLVNWINDRFPEQEATLDRLGLRAVAGTAPLWIETRRQFMASIRLEPVVQGPFMASRASRYGPVRKAIRELWMTTKGVTATFRNALCDATLRAIGDARNLPVFDVEEAHVNLARLVGRVGAAVPDGEDPVKWLHANLARNVQRHLWEQNHRPVGRPPKQMTMLSLPEPVLPRGIMSFDEVKRSIEQHLLTTDALVDSGLAAMPTVDMLTPEVQKSLAFHVTSLGRSPNGWLQSMAAVNGRPWSGTRWSNEQYVGRVFAPLAAHARLWRNNVTWAGYRSAFRTDLHVKLTSRNGLPNEHWAELVRSGTEIFIEAHGEQHFERVLDWVDPRPADAMKTEDISAYADVADHPVIQVVLHHGVCTERVLPPDVLGDIVTSAVKDGRWWVYVVPAGNDEFPAYPDHFTEPKRSTLDWQSPVDVYMSA